MSTGRLLRVNDLGAIGSLLITRGSINAGKNDLKVQDATGWKEGAGVSVAGAGVDGGNWRSRVRHVKGNVLELNDQPPRDVVNGAVNSDDYVPIQAALEQLRVTGGGVALLDGGTYVLGTLTALDVVLPGGLVTLIRPTRFGRRYAVGSSDRSTLMRRPTGSFRISRLCSTRGTTES